MIKIMKFMFYIIMMLGTLISISAFSWFNIWIGLELNLLAFIPIINYDNFKYSSEVALKYFLVQVSASLFILFSFIYSLMLNSSLEQMEMLPMFMFNSAILMKMGAAPFHFWYPEIAEGLSWMNLLVLMTWQKIAPMVLIMYNFSMNLMFCLIILMSMILSSMKSWNQTNLKKILVLSSINHTGWMLSMMFLNQSLWMLYFMIYSFITINMIYIFNKFKIFYLNDLFNLMNYNKYMKMFYFFNFFSLGGIPPFLGFFPKWLALKIMLENNLFLLAFLMIFLTLIFLFIYMRLIIQALLFKMYNKKPFKTYKLPFIFYINWINLTGLVMFTMIFSMY
uniref:NADH-ubiquinone oxidoreductase chain 2 n=2 Tax=Hippodamia convergens TaxID=64696 RepID=A0A1B1W5L1_HIPCN|nr:nad2 [Hippodamia convergens]